MFSTRTLAHAAIIGSGAILLLVLAHGCLGLIRIALGPQAEHLDFLSKLGILAIAFIVGVGLLLLVKSMLGRIFFPHLYRKVTIDRRFASVGANPAKKKMPEPGSRLPSEEGIQNLEASDRPVERLHAELLRRNLKLLESREEIWLVSTGTAAAPDKASLLHLSPDEASSMLCNGIAPVGIVVDPRNDADTVVTLGDAFRGMSSGNIEQRLNRNVAVALFDTGRARKLDPVLSSKLRRCYDQASDELALAA